MLSAGVFLFYVQVKLITDRSDLVLHHLRGATPNGEPNLYALRIALAGSLHVIDQGSVFCHVYYKSRNIVVKIITAGN